MCPVETLWATKANESLQDMHPSDTMRCSCRRPGDASRSGAVHVRRMHVDLLPTAWQGWWLHSTAHARQPSACCDGGILWTVPASAGPLALRLECGSGAPGSAATYELALKPPEDLDLYSAEDDPDLPARRSAAPQACAGSAAASPGVGHSGAAAEAASYSGVRVALCKVVCGPSECLVACAAVTWRYSPSRPGEDFALDCTLQGDDSGAAVAMVSEDGHSREEFTALQLWSVQRPMAAKASPVAAGSHAGVGGAQKRKRGSCDDAAAADSEPPAAVPACCAFVIPQTIADIADVVLVPAIGHEGVLVISTLVPACMQLDCTPDSVAHA